MRRFLIILALLFGVATCVRGDEWKPQNGDSVAPVNTDLGTSNLSIVEFAGPFGPELQVIVTIYAANGGTIQSITGSTSMLASVNDDTHTQIYKELSVNVGYQGDAALIQTMPFAWVPDNSVFTSSTLWNVNVKMPNGQIRSFQLKVNDKAIVPFP